MKIKKELKMIICMKIFQNLKVKNWKFKKSKFFLNFIKIEKVLKP